MPKSKEKTAEFEVGQLVSFEMDGKTLQGTITKINTKKEEADVEGDDLPDNLVCEFHEMTIIPKGKSKGKEKEEEPEKEEKPAKGKGEGKSLKSAFNSKPPAEGGPMGFPVGTYECLVTDGLCATNDKGTSAYLELCIVNNDDGLDGRSSRKFYQLVDPDGDVLDGVGYLKADMIMVGLWDEDFEIESENVKDLVEELNTSLKKLKKKMPWVSVNVTEGKKNYTNIYLQSLMENQESKPDKPE